MKKFNGLRKLQEIFKLAKENGWKVDTTDFDEKGSDFIIVRDMDKRMTEVKFNTVNGQFFVFNPSSERAVATHLSTKLDDEEWFNEILDLFYK